MKKVFLGGTCNNSNWRKSLIPMLEIDFFNPVVKNWTLECQEEEIRQREECDFVLYYITPKMLGVYSIAEVIDDSNKRPEKTIFCYTGYDGDNKFEFDQIKSLKAVAKMVQNNGAFYFEDIDSVLTFLNSQK